MTIRSALIVLALSGCQPTRYQPISGVINVGPYEGDGVATEGTVSILDTDLEVISSGPIGPDGSFEVTGIEGENLVARVDGPGFEAAHFSGHVGIGPLEVPEGEIFAWPTLASFEARTAFGACSVPGAMVPGEIRIFGVTDDQGVSPSLNNAWAFLYGSDGVEIPACYLDDEGVYDPAATRTGASGRFAFFGVPAGRYDLAYGYDLSDEYVVEHGVAIVVPEDGVVPLYPAWVDLVL